MGRAPNDKLETPTSEPSALLNAAHVSFIVVKRYVNSNAAQQGSELEKNINMYFKAEKQESLLFIAVGLLATAVAAWLWMNGHRLRSMAYTFVAIALIQLVVGATVFLRTDGQMTHLNPQVAQAPAIFKQGESQRMDVVIKTSVCTKSLRWF